MSDYKTVMTLHPDGRITTEGPQEEVVQGVLYALQEQIQYMLKCATDPLKAQLAVCQKERDTFEAALVELSKYVDECGMGVLAGKALVQVNGEVK